MSALARHRRVRRAGRVHAALRSPDGPTWRVVIVMAGDGAGGEGRESARRHLAAGGWAVALHREDGEDILVAECVLPGGDDLSPEAVATSVLDRLGAMVDADVRHDLTDGARIDDLILIPPGARDSDWDLLWLDPAERLIDAWGGRGSHTRTRQVIADLRAHWQVAAASAPPEVRSLADELF